MRTDRLAVALWTTAALLIGAGEVLRRQLDRRFCRWANLTHEE